MRKRRRGQDLDLSARDWNRLVDSDNAGGIGQSPGTAGEVGPQFVRVKNTLGRDLDRFAAVCIGPALFLDATPMTPQMDVAFQLVNGSLRGQDYYNDGGEPLIGILPTPIANGQFGLAQIEGVALAKFKALDTLQWSRVPNFATIADTDDRLAFASFGPIRVMPYPHMPTAALDAYVIPVKLGHQVTLGSARIGIGTTNTFTWVEASGNNYGAWQSLGDFARVGIYGTTGANSGLPMLSRQGRYLIQVDAYANISASGFLSNDRLEWKITWPVFLVGDPQSVQYGSVTPSGWSGAFSVNTFFQRDYQVQLGAAETFALPIPGFRAVRIPATGTGAGTGLPVTSFGKLYFHVVRLGSNNELQGSFWTQAKRDAAWGRGQDSGPV